MVTVNAVGSLRNGFASAANLQQQNGTSENETNRGPERAASATTSPATRKPSRFQVRIILSLFKIFYKFYVLKKLQLIFFVQHYYFGHSIDWIGICYKNMPLYINLQLFLRLLAKKNAAAHYL